MSISNQLVVFELDGRDYGLYTTVVELVVRAVEITPLPEAPACIAGIINFHGTVVPVFDLRQRFGLPAREIELADQMILARTSNRLVALLVDQVGGVLECGETEVVPTEMVVGGTEFVPGVVTRPDGLVLIHDLDSFLSRSEEKALKAALKSA